MAGRVLHVLSQRPSQTGSGITLEAMIHEAEEAGWQQAAVVGVPADVATTRVGGLDASRIHPLRFATDGNRESGDLPYPVPGMSDVMPYASSVWSEMTAGQLDQYRRAWRRHLGQVIRTFRPDVIHSHHIWVVSSLLKEIAPDRPVVTTCHSTGLRQMHLTPHLAEEVRRGCSRIDHFCVLRDDHGRDLQESLAVGPERITVVGAGYRPEVFRHLPGMHPDPDDLLFVGKYSHAKGMPWMLEAFDLLRKTRPGLTLHVAGSGSGPEADGLRARLEDLRPAVVMHGQLDQSALADLMRQCGVCVLPSFYEGVPLVLVEAAACGAELVTTALPGVMERIHPHLGDRMQVVPLPRLTSVDRPVEDDLPGFVEALHHAMDEACRKAANANPPSSAALAPFTWQSVFERVETVWRNLIS